MSRLAYSNPYEHLRDEFRRLDLLIRLEFVERGTDAFDSFRGLVITASEVNSLVDPRGPESMQEADALREKIERISHEIGERRRHSVAEGALPFDRLQDLFSLGTTEERIVLLGLAPEVDAKYEKLFAYLHDDVTRKQPSLQLVQLLMCPSAEQRVEARACFEPGASLVKYGLIEMAAGPGPLLSRGFQLDERVAAFLLGSAVPDARLERVAAWFEPEEAAPAAPLDRQMESFARKCLAQPAAAPAVFYVRGGNTGTARRMAASASRESGLPVIAADAARLLTGPEPFDDLIWRLAREAALQPAALLIENCDALLESGGKARVETLLRAALTFSRLTILSGRHSWPAVDAAGGLFVEVAAPVPDAGARRADWQRRLAGLPLDSDIDVGALASTFRFTPAQIDSAVSAASAHALWHDPAGGRLSGKELYRACRGQSGHALEALARKVETNYTWDDIVLPAEVIATLREITGRVRRRDRVMSDWGFSGKLSLGRGVSSLFAGPSGTGKTMATEVIAGDLGLDLYKVDLAGVVSKYIGETEKNLSAIFAAAEDSNAILLFDEADALFGKRSEVRDSHDRYANLEISYLLQRMEEYEGLAILATNLLQNLDEAFIRRLAFTVYFPFPEAADRHRMWRNVWPGRVPLEPGLDLDFLARHFPLTGASIKNIALSASFLAARDESAVSMAHLLHATRGEFQKLGKMLSDAELYGAYAETGAIV